MCGNNPQNPWICQENLVSLHHNQNIKNTITIMRKNNDIRFDSASGSILNPAVAGSSFTAPAGRFYGKSELACKYFPKLTPKAAWKKLKSFMLDSRASCSTIPISLPWPRCPAAPSPPARPPSSSRPSASREVSPRQIVKLPYY